MQQIHIKSDLLYAQPLSDHDGYTWTLVSRLGEMLYRLRRTQDHPTSTTGCLISY